MPDKRDVWNYREERVDDHLEKQNGRIREAEDTMNKWKGVAIGIIAISTAISSLIAMAMK